MYTFEFNDSLRYRSREQLAEELRNMADRVESGCREMSSLWFNCSAGWLHSDHYDDDDLTDYYEEEDEE